MCCTFNSILILVHIHAIIAMCDLEYSLICVTVVSASSASIHLVQAQVTLGVELVKPASAEKSDDKLLNRCQNSWAKLISCKFNELNSWQSTNGAYGCLEL